MHMCRVPNRNTRGRRGGKTYGYSAPLFLLSVRNFAVSLTEQTRQQEGGKPRHWMCMCASVSSDRYTSLLAWNTQCKSANGGTVSFVP